MALKIVEGSRRPHPRKKLVQPVFFLADGAEVIAPYSTREEAEAALRERQQRNRRGKREHASGPFDALIDAASEGHRP